MRPFLRFFCICYYLLYIFGRNTKRGGVQYYECATAVRVPAAQLCVGGAKSSGEPLYVGIMRSSVPAASAPNEWVCCVLCSSRNFCFLACKSITIILFRQMFLGILFFQIRVNFRQPYLRELSYVRMCVWTVVWCF